MGATGAVAVVVGFCPLLWTCVKAGVEYACVIQIAAAHRTIASTRTTAT
jgi:hypothetical protein